MDARQLQAQLVKGRRSDVSSVNGMSFTIQRPTEMELVRMRNGTSTDINLDCIQRNVVGWSGVKESDIVGTGGASDVVPFDRGLFSAWIEDHPEHWDALVAGFGKAVDDYSKYLETLRGN